MKSLFTLAVFLLAFELPALGAPVAEASEGRPVRNQNFQTHQTIINFPMKHFFSLLLLFCGMSAFAQVVNIPDAKFKLTLLTQPCATLFSAPAVQTDVDSNDDGEIQTSEAAEVATLNISSRQISSIIGITAFENLHDLNISNNSISNLDILSLIKLKTLNCNNNALSTINIQSLTNLEEFRCNNNGLTLLDLTTNNAITILDCSHNDLINLNISNLILIKELYCSNNWLGFSELENNNKLEILHCNNNQIGALDLTNLVNLRHFQCENNNMLFMQCDSLPYLIELNCSNNSLSFLNLNKAPELTILNAKNNIITEIDLSKSPKITEIDLLRNKLKYMNLKNGTIVNELRFNDNPELKHICCDLPEITNIIQFIQASNLTGVIVNNYCSVTPGGKYYIIEGNVKFDISNNSCLDSAYASNAIKIQIPATQISLEDIILPHEQFKFYLPEGSFNINVQPLTPTLFQASPAQFQVNFPADSSPHQVDICLKPIGNQHDVSISLIPETPFRPGFVSRFKLVYQNKGNQLSEGVITLNFDDNRLDLLQSSVVPDLQNGGTLKWNYSGLRPLESKYIILQLYCNSPADNPAVQIGNLFSFSGGIDGIDPDKTFADNFINLRLETVGSYDPNDKTCLEGERIDPAMVGEFVHYLIRFENTGTYPAEFIVVRDTINTNVFDLNSLEVVATSHPMYTRILQGNRVEFIYENINLPFDDANNDGYVAFRIRTRAGLSIGDKLENRAAIYFDYNLPIITNTAQTVVAPLVDTYTPGDKNAIRLSPNPATNRVYFQSEQAISHVQVHSAEGRLLYSGPLQNNSLSLEGMAQGLYWVRVYSAEQYETFKLIKQ